MSVIILDPVPEEEEEEREEGEGQEQEQHTSPSFAYSSKSRAGLLAARAHIDRLLSRYNKARGLADEE